MTDHAHETLQGLYNIPIETFGLSGEALRNLKWEGITIIADCLVFYYQDVHQTGFIPAKTACIMYGEVAPKLKEHGYWTHILDADMWHLLGRESNVRPVRRIVIWRGREQDLYQVPIETLDLSVKALEAAKRARITNVGACLHAFIQNLRLYGVAYDAEAVMSKAARATGGVLFSSFLWGEIQLKVKELGYWCFVEDNLPLE